MLMVAAHPPGRVDVLRGALADYCCFIIHFLLRPSANKEHVGHRDHFSPPPPFEFRDDSLPFSNRMSSHLQAMSRKISLLKPVNTKI
jgi:hypothetical protein